MTVADDFATLHAVADEFNSPRMRTVLKRVEAEIARLEQQVAADVLGFAGMRQRAEAAETEVARWRSTAQVEAEEVNLHKAEVARLRDEVEREGTSRMNTRAALGNARDDLRDITLATELGDAVAIAARALLAEDGAARAKELRAAADAAWERGNKDVSESLHAKARELEDGAA